MPIGKETTMATTLRMFRTTILLLVSAALLSACYARFQILNPTADAVVSPSSAVHIVVSGGRVSDITLNIDGNDVTSQIVLDPNTGNYFLDKALPAGMHTINASALAYCSYCSGQQYLASDSKMFCVADASTLTAKTLSAKGDDMGWSSTDTRTVALATNDATTRTQWTLIPKGSGLVSVPGFIQSRQFPCSCLRSPNDTNKAVVELAPCDFNDPRQVWNGTREQQAGGTGLYQFRNEGVGALNAGCLAEGNDNDGTGGKLVQDFCTGAADRLWKVQRIDDAQFEGDQNPWAR
jgi:hypothetical protein